MTAKRFNSYCDNENIRIRIDDDIKNKEIFHIYFVELDDALYCKSKLNPTLDLLNQLSDENEELKKRISKIQSKYDKSKTDEVNILVETENTVLLDKSEFQEYVRRHKELRKRNKRRKEKNRKYRNELKKRLREISGLKEFIAEDLSTEDKVLKGFIEEYL